MSKKNQRIKVKELQLKEAEQRTQRLYNQVKHMRNAGNISLSDHAVVRFVERCKGFNMEQVRQELLTPQVLRLYHLLGDGEFPTGEGTTRVVIKNGVIVTVLK